MLQKEQKKKRQVKRVRPHTYTCQVGYLRSCYNLTEKKIAQSVSDLEDRINMAELQEVRGHLSRCSVDANMCARCWSNNSALRHLRRSINSCVCVNKWMCECVLGVNLDL